MNVTQSWEQSHLCSGDGPYEMMWKTDEKSTGVALGAWTTPSNIIRGDTTYPMNLLLSLDELVKISAALPVVTRVDQWQETGICGICNKRVEENQARAVWFSEIGSFAHRECIALAATLDEQIATALSKYYYKGEYFAYRTNALAHFAIRSFCESFGLSLRSCLEDVVSSKMATTVMIEKLVAVGTH